MKLSYTRKLKMKTMCLLCVILLGQYQLTVPKLGVFKLKRNIKKKCKNKLL
jgi:hypothetical protein